MGMSFAPQPPICQVLETHSTPAPWQAGEWKQVWEGGRTSWGKLRHLTITPKCQLSHPVYTTSQLA